MSDANESASVERQKVSEAIYQAIDQINETLPEEKKIVKSPETVLLGAGKAIDSLGLTMLIVAIEEKIERMFGEVITLVDASTMSEEHSPFKSIEKLAHHITELLKERQS